MRDSSAKKGLLVTGSMGQIGSELVPELARANPDAEVVSCDIKRGSSPNNAKGRGRVTFAYLDVTDKEAIRRVAKEFSVDAIYHLAGVLSANGESDPERTMTLNIGGLRNILDVARESDATNVFWPSSIAVFGPDARRENTPQDSALFPGTVYGITKVSGELLCNYYFKRFGLDVRCLRLPGIISAETVPGGGTTDYAVEIFYKAIAHARYDCFVEKETVLPMLYMPDCIEAITRLTRAPRSQITLRYGYNIGGMRFSAEELVREIKKHVPGFEVEYRPDSRMEIARSWPRSIDDRRAKKDWGWRLSYDLASMTRDMIRKLLMKKLAS